MNTSQRLLLGAVGAITVVVFLVSSAYAQAPPTQNSDETLAEVVVTGSRVTRTGFTAPTPTTVVGAAEIELRAANSVGDTLNELPGFRATSSPTTNTVFPTNGIAQTHADLRGLGSVRTLSLLNGRRHVATAATGQVDLALIPSILVERAEVVTGGASAAWGSNAVAGVVNLILKNNLQGIETTAQYGISGQSDDQNWKLGIAAGTGFSGNRGHFIVGGEYSDSEGVAPMAIRKWNKDRGSVDNTWVGGVPPANGLPARIYTDNWRWGNMASGGLITGLPLGPPNPAAQALLGLTFNPDGSVRPFQFGQRFGSTMIGGETFALPQLSPGLKSPIKRYSALSRVEYDLTDSLNAFVEVSLAEVEANITAAAPRDFGASGRPIPPAGAPFAAVTGTVIARTENPYMPATLRNQMTAAGISAVFLGRYNDDLGYFNMIVPNQTQRYVFGLDGGLGGKGNWKWDAYYQYGRNEEKTHSTNRRIDSFWQQAIDVVDDPTIAGVQPICRSTIANRTNGCVPFNIFGSGASTQAARDYVTEDGFILTRATQKVAAANLNGELFQLNAGPVVLATGVEWRTEDLFQDADSLAKDINQVSAFFIPTNGSIDVKEVYAELVTPLVKDAAFAKGVDLSLAGRYTDYSTSGGVPSWKVGVSWDVNNQLRFRGTVSRDIRAANIAELYAANTRVPFLPVDKILGRPSGFAVALVGGNPNLEPELGTTYTGGVVFQTEGRALRTSVDFYRIEIKDQIVALGGQEVIDRCALNLTSTYCSQIQRNPLTQSIESVISPNVNLIGFLTSGVDVELAYARPLSIIPGQIMIQAFANYTHELTRIDELGKIDRSNQPGLGFGGTIGVPRWQGNVTLIYKRGGYSGSVQTRIVKGGEIDTLAIPGTATSANVYTVPTGYLWNLTSSYDFKSGLGGAKRFQVFGLVDNVLDAEPPFPISQSPYYDAIGRTYRVGVRLKY
jgi:outer membrane receptor protein involved in Fe transport